MLATPAKGGHPRDDDLRFRKAEVRSKREVAIKRGAGMARRNWAGMEEGTASRPRIWGTIVALLVVGGLVRWGLIEPKVEGAQGAPGWSVEQVLRSPFPGEMVADRAGRQLAWVFNAEGRRNIWLAEEGGNRARQLTQFESDTGQEISSVQFTHDGAWIVFVRGGTGNSAREVPNPTSDPKGAVQAILAVEVGSGRIVALAQGDRPRVSPVSHQVVFEREGRLWLSEIATGGGARLGDRPGPLFLARGELGSAEWSPAGDRLAFVSQRRTHSLIGVLDVKQQRVAYLVPSVDRDSLPRWSPDGRHLAFLRQEGAAEAPGREAMEPWSIQVVEFKEGGERYTSWEVWRSGIEPTDAMPLIAGENRLHWAADNRLVFSSEMDGWLHLYAIETERRAAGAVPPQPRLLTPGPCEYEEMVLTPDRREIIFSSNCGDLHRRHLWRVTVAQGEPSAITSGRGLEWRPVVLANGTELAWLSSTDREPAAVRWQKADGTVVRVAAETHPTDFPDPSALVTPEAVSFTSADGMTVHGQLFLPRERPAGEQLPAVLFMHGGPNRQMMLGWHNRGYYHHAYGFNQYLASRGYAVLAVNYRLGTGYGRAFRMARNGGGRGAAEYQDILAAAHWLRSRAEIDPARIGLWGGSYGGFLVALGLARNSDLFAAGVDLHGVHDWYSRLGAGGDREAVRIARQSSPLAAVGTWRSPVLLVHGDDDRNVAFSQTVDLVRQLRAADVPFELKVYPDEVHDFLLHRHWQEIFESAAAFFERELKGAGRRTENRPRPIDLLIRNGQIHDGTGVAPYRGEVAIIGDRIVYVGPPPQTEGGGKSTRWDPVREIDARGMVVAPGFIDPHTHTAEDLASTGRRANLPYLTQGVTTVVTGNDGNSPFPIGETLARWQSEGIGTNAALLVGHGTIRQRVMGLQDTPPSEPQLKAMQELIRQAMREGAIGMSTGLYYAPGNFATTEEVIALARVVAGFGGIYDTHMRDESSYSIGVMAAIEESIRIGREAGLPIHLSHLKMLGLDVWGRADEAIQRIEQARREGIEVTANQYPYTASGTSLTAALVPRWAEAGGDLLKRIADPTLRPRLVGEMEVNLRRRGGPSALLLTSTRDPKLIGLTLDQIARQQGQAPIDVALEIIREGGAGVASFNMNEQDIERLMKQPWVMTGSDGSTGHPRKYGTYPRKIRDYVLTRRILSLPRMIEASSRQVAQTLRIPERGTLAAGYYADVIVFDPATIAERATYETPATLSIGLRFVLVNGRLALEEGEPTGILAGRALKK
jgi:N-acyl-D-amino-acid deacylase